MSRIGKPRETGNKFMVVWGWGFEGERRGTAYGYRASLWGDEKALKWIVVVVEQL